MKHATILFLMLLLTACRAPGSVAASSPLPAPATPTEVSPVYVSALCKLMGLDARTEVPKDRPMIVMWGWSAATMEQVQDYLDAALVKVTFDQKELAGQMQKEVPYDETSKIYRAVWMADVGIPATGVHVITYWLEFQRKIFDGTDYYGPGTANEKMSDRCEVDVK
jgi:hypothetical protein